MSRLVICALEQNLAHLQQSSEHFGSQICKTLNKVHCVQCIRFYRARKPFWLPVAKTKMFRFTEQPKLPKEEKVEMTRLNNVYRTQMKSLLQYFKEQLMAKSTGIEVIEERKKMEIEQHAQCIKNNELWNAEVAKLREERLAKLAIEREEKILKKIIDHEKRQNALMDQINTHIRQEKEAAKTFITPANIDEAIEVALASVVDHNFCIDLQGNIYNGRYGKPPPSLPKDKKPRTSEPSYKEEKSISVEASN